MNGIVMIHGKEYLTVAYRVNQFRADHPDWAIVTELVESGEVVVMKASIKDENDRTLGTGYAEEIRGSTQINSTSALENCETSAIGRALAACGYAGTEYASANEVENAISQQKTGQMSGEKLDMGKIHTAANYIMETIDADITEEERIKKLHAASGRLSNDEKLEVNSLLDGYAPGTRRKYKNIFGDYLKEAV